jgi:hypothetical protein
MEDGTMTKERTINGVKFSVAPFMAIEALKLKAFLIRTFGPALGQALGTLKNGLPGSGKISEINLDGTALSQAIEKLMEQLNEEEFISLIKRLLGYVTAKMARDGKVFQLAFTENVFEESLNMVFSGRLFTIYPVILFVLQVNYPDFFDQVAHGIGKKIGKMISSGPAGQEPKNESDESESSESSIRK